MLFAPFKVVLDANVLYPFTLRDTILRAAALDLFQPYWSDEILDEVTRNLIADGRMRPDQAKRLLTAMETHFDEARVDGYQHLISAMPNQEKDRHVVAAAVHAGATVIVTRNLKDFRQLPTGIEAESPDNFLCGLFDLSAAEMIDMLRQQAADLKNPPKTFEDILAGLSSSVPNFVKVVRERIALSDE